MEALKKLIEDFKLEVYYHEGGVTAIVKGHSRKTGIKVDNSILIEGTHNIDRIYATILSSLEEFLGEKYSYEVIEDPEEQLQLELEQYFSEGETNG